MTQLTDWGGWGWTAPLINYVATLGSVLSFTESVFNNSRLHFLEDEFELHEIIKLKSAVLTAHQSLALVWPQQLSFLSPPWHSPVYKGKSPRRGSGPLQSDLRSTVLVTSVPLTLHSHCSFVFSAFLFARYGQMVGLPSVFTFSSVLATGHFTKTQS